jgi:hypothetical protein
VEVEAPKRLLLCPSSSAIAHIPTSLIPSPLDITIIIVIVFVTYLPHDDPIISSKVQLQPTPPFLSCPIPSFPVLSFPFRRQHDNHAASPSHSYNCCSFTKSNTLRSNNRRFLNPWFSVGFLLSYSLSLLFFPSHRQEQLKPNPEPYVFAISPDPRLQLQQPDSRYVSRGVILMTSSILLVMSSSRPATIELQLSSSVPQVPWS